MTLNVVALDRGGCSAHGSGWWDPRERLVMLDVLIDEVLDVVVQFPESVASVDYEEDGIDGATPVISTNTVSVQFQELNPGGSYQLEATYSSGAKRRVRFMANIAQPLANSELNPTDDDDVDYGDWG